MPKRLCFCFSLFVGWFVHQQNYSKVINEFFFNFWKG